MGALAAVRSLDRTQRHTVLACFLGWMLDAFDYFVLVLVLKDVAKDFHTDVTEVSLALLLTLAARPLGALIFGHLADRYGRRPVMMWDVALYSVLGLACAFAPSLGVLLALRFAFGIAMGGEWGIGASLALEVVPAKARGFVSGLMQNGYPCGYFLAALVYWLVFDHFGWRGMFAVGAIPALLVLYIRRSVPESPVWQAAQTARAKIRPLQAMRGHWKLFAYLLVLMAVFNMFSHGSQDMYPTFLKAQMGFGTGTVTVLTMVLNAGALVGGFLFGMASERIGRRRAIVIAAILVLPCIPMWAYGGSLIVLALGAFLVQVMVQGAWSVVPTHLNELSPGPVRATLPGVAYQLGSLLVAMTPTVEAMIAHARGGDYAFAMSVSIGSVAVLLAILAWFGPEAKGREFADAG